MITVRASRNRGTQLTERLGSYFADRSRAGALLADLPRRAFPDHWSVMLGQVAFHSFIVVVLTGAFLVFFYDPSIEQVTYDGSYLPLNGVEMSRALESTLHLSFEVRGGLLMRQAHHWASLLMVAAIMLHMLRLFFTGAFRRPRQWSWVAVFLILLTTMAAAFTGGILPDDMRSGTSMAVMDGVVKSMPVVGPWLSALMFGGAFPGDVLALFYPLHIVILPILLLVLFAASAALALIHGPAQYPGPGRTNDNVVGRPLPVLAAKSGALFVMVCAIVLLMAGTATVNPVWTYGPADPENASAGSGPFWYLAFLDGALRLVPPGWEFVWLGQTWTLAVLIPVAVVTLFLVVFAAYPFVEAWITGDRRPHHLLERPRHNATRTALGVAGITFYGVLWATAGADTIAAQFRLSIESIVHGFQAAVIVGPVIGFIVTRRICLALQLRDREVALHGVETGQIKRLPGGGYVESRQPVDAYDRFRLVSVGERKPLTMRPPDARGRITRLQLLRLRLSRYFSYGRIPPPPDGDHVRA